jgi:type I restriction-modification system DNA methylase subunit
MGKKQLALPYGPIRNKNLLSNHWLEHRLGLEPEWREFRQAAEDLLTRLGILWKKQKQRVEQYTEPNLEQKFIHPILDTLGWTFLYQTFLRGRKPDYALFLQDQDLGNALKDGRKSPKFWEHATLVGDAKSWLVSLDRPIRVENKREYPPEQIEWYIHNSQRKYGLLTNGKLWRLYPHDLSTHQPRFETYLECDLADLLDRWALAGGNKGQTTIHERLYLIQDFLRFYLFFSPVAFMSIDGRKPLIDRAVEGSNEYRLGVGEGLKERVFEALQTSIQGFFAFEPNALDHDTDMGICREQSLVLLYRLLFVMYAEDRDLLPYRGNRLYRENRSLRNLRELVASRIDRANEGRHEDFDLSSRDLWDSLATLFDLVNRGGKRYSVPAYNGGLFDEEENQFLTENAIGDWHLSRVIDQLSRAPDPKHTDYGLFSVDYRDLSIQHLGHVYEGLLELQPYWATESMLVIRKKVGQKIQERVIPSSKAIPQGFEETETVYDAGEVYLLGDKGERRASGSYYTPHDIVDLIIQETLGPICQQTIANLESEIQETETKRKRSRGRNRELLDQKLKALRSDFDDRVLSLKVLDPAMGSGHFLLRACQYLAEEIATNPYANDPHAGQFASDESTLTFWKRRIVEHCLYGVDLNPLAVELAKVALWLETAATDYPLTFLDHHLRCGNSLVGATMKDLNSLPCLDSMPLLEQVVSSQLPAVIEGLKLISKKPSDTADQVKEKAKIYHQTVERIRQPFIDIANVWCATFFLDKKDQLTPDMYKDVIESSRVRKRYNQIKRQGWFQKAIQAVQRPDIAAFHWELEFPDVFLGNSGHPQETGFDAVIGNPPWGHAQQLNVLKMLPLYGPIADDHAECFVCLAIALLRCPGGRVGLVLPDTILSPKKRGIRRKMLEGIHSDAILNIGPDWFTSDVRMSTVLWNATTMENPMEEYGFRSCVLPIKIRRAAQASKISLESAIRQCERTARTDECLANKDVSVPLFGDDEAVALRNRITAGAPTLNEVCDHGRGVELNKSGHVIQCPKCKKWDAPPLKDEQGGFKNKKCTHCGEEYPIGDNVPSRILVSTDQASFKQCKPYLDGDSIIRYKAPLVRWIDISADGINYKPEALYRQPKLLIRQAGIGVNAILDQNIGTYCPQSVYVYRVKPIFHERNIDEFILISLLCSRLFHLQIFMSFGEIDSSRAFSKLTHTRLCRMHTVRPAIMQKHPIAISRLRECAAILCSEGIAGNEHLDWEAEGLWSHILGLTYDDISCVISNFAKVHHNETMQALFPGGIEQEKNKWIDTWIGATEQASKRCKC